MTRVYGVLGWPVAHSLSPAMHNAAFAARGLDATYVRFPVRPAALGDAMRGLRALGLAGVNLTVPHKTAVLPRLDSVDEAARAVGAVNTLILRAGGVLHGANTDVEGLLRALGEAAGARGGLDLRGARALVLGAGGAARAAVFGLTRAGAEVSIAARRRAQAEHLAADLGGVSAVIALDDADALREAFGAADVVVQASSATMSVAADIVAHASSETMSAADIVVQASSEAVSAADIVVQASSEAVSSAAQAFVDALPLDALRARTLVMDLVYAPRDTALLVAARARGAETVDGLAMLLHQGALAFELWTGLDAPLEVMRAALVGAQTPSR